MESATALSAAVRESHLAQMAEPPLDVLVIGGGITGAGVALDAAARGYRVGLVERGDFASGTSSRSTKLVHGGIRYLPELDIALVREALLERGRLLRNAPHLVRPLAFVLPLYASSRHPVGLPVAPPGGIGLGVILNMGLLTYDVLAGRENIAPHKQISCDEVATRAPGLIQDGVKTGFIYYDALTDDSRLTLAVVRSAAERGALVANYSKVVRFVRESGRVVGAYIQDTLARAETGGNGTGGERLILARHIVNATGVWAADTERVAGETPRLHIAPSKGVHLVISREAIDLGDEALVLPETEDGRIVFIVPWHSRALVGTTDTGVQRIGNPVATDEEVEYLLAHVNRYARRRLAEEDVVATYAGYRPLLRFTGARTPSRLSRTHAVVESPEGLLTVSGGKLTTYRRMAQDVLDRIDRREGRSPRHPTQDLLLSGAYGWSSARRELHMRGRALGLGEDELDHLGQAFGSHALALLTLIEAQPVLRTRLVRDLPYLRAEVVYACRAEMALRPQDVLARRTHLNIEDRSRGTGVIDDVGDLMAGELDWSAAERDQRVASYVRYAREQMGPLADLEMTPPGISHSESIPLA